MNKFPRFFTGVQPTGTLTLGNYCGLIYHILKIQDEHEVIIMVADLHALTVPKKDFDYSQESCEIAALLYACRLNQNCKVFIQSQIKEHLELTWLLAPFVTVSELKNMIQYKEKKKQQETGNLTLLSYPVLQAADIFLYEADLVIVGQDQQQHTELAQHVAQKFNNFYEKNLLKIPQFTISNLGGKIMGLKNPEKKMSKSENDYISLLDSPELVEEKLKKAKTDNENKTYYDPYNENKKWISNLLTICALLEDKQINEIEKELEISKLDYSQFKKKVAEIINKKLTLIQQNYKQLLPTIKEKLKENNDYVQILAQKKMKEIRKELKL